MRLHGNAIFDIGAEKYRAVMIKTIDADDAWCPPTLMPSTLGRRSLALWIIQCESHSTRC